MSQKRFARLAGWIPTHVPARVIVWVYRLLELIDIIPKRIRDKHMRNNIRRLGECPRLLIDGYIDNQSEWTDVAFGKTTMALAGCEIIAVYNVLKALGRAEGAQAVGELIAAFEHRGAALNGRIGTSMLAIGAYLKKQGIRTRLIYNIEDIDTDIDMAIVTIYNNYSSLYHQIHTIAIIKDDRGFVPYNARVKRVGFETLTEAVEASAVSAKIICVYPILH